MKRYRGTEQGPRGFYLNLSTAEFVQLHEKVRLLPGSSEVKYIKVPSVLAMIASPFVGLAFIIFLPFAGIAGFAGYLGYQLWRGVLALERRTVQLVAIGWEPGKAYFTRHGSTQGKKPGTKTEEELDNLEEEVATRRQQGEQ